MADSKPDSTPAKAKARPKALRVPRRAPDHWRDALGVSPGIHAACDIAHGWTVTAREFVAEPVALTEKDYIDAITASKSHDAKGRIRVHPPAVGKARRARRVGTPEEAAAKELS